MRKPESPPPERGPKSVRETLREQQSREQAGRETINQREVGREQAGKQNAEAAHQGDFLADHRAPRPEFERRPLTGTQRRVIAFTWIAMFMMMLYAAFMGLSFFNPGYRPIDYIGVFMLLFGLTFILLHGLGYANSVIKASWGYDEVRRRAFSPQSAPKVACLIASYNEPAEVLEETIAAVVNLDYAHKQIVVLDDSTNEDSRKTVRELGAKYNVEVVQRTNRRGYKAGAINDYIRKLNTNSDVTYVAIFDSDALPAHNFLRDLVPIIEEDPRLAFVQTPQYYANTEISNVALAAARQQAVFFEYICEGKSHSHAIFCCGTNVIFRRQALQDVNGFVEDSVTEDFATSLNMHLKGYDSSYYNQVYVYSLAPETLAAYFTQQSRWALGSTGMFRNVMGALFGGAGRLRLGQWYEYFLSTTYYWIGWVNFFFMLLPLMYIFLNVKPLRQDVFTYTAIFIPYLIFTMNMFYSGMEARGYKMQDMILGQQMAFICFPTHMISALSGILGVKPPFATTPKGHGGKISWLSLWPQILMLVLSAIAVIWAIYLYSMGYRRNDSAILINAMWALYHVFLLSGVFVLNKVPMRRSEYEKHFEEGDVRLSKARVIQTSELASATAVSGPGLFAPVGAGGETTASVPAEKRRVIAPPRPNSAAGGWAFGLMIVSLILIGLVAWNMIGWWLAPTYPVNVYVVDRTTGRDYQEHRSLIWTLNYLKLKKENGFGPQGDASSGGSYDFAKDYWGYIPGDPANAQTDETNQADLVVSGQNRPLPEEFKAPGVVYLADTYGEFVEYDYGQEKYIRYVSEPRGLQPDEIDRVEDFHGRGGLVIAEWNTIGFPTLPGDNVTDRAALAAGLGRVEKGLIFYRTQELPARQRGLREAQQRGDRNAIDVYEQQIADTQARIKKAERDRADLQILIETAAGREAQLAAQQRLERILKADYRGWYGRYVDNFADEREYDFRLWKNVQDALRRRFPDDKNKWEPRGPGFVFYRDGAKEIFNPETQKLEPNPFSEPVVITEDELGEGPTNHYAEIVKNSKAANDPLLKGVPESMACRFWFDVVRPMPGAQVLAYYKLQLKDSAAERLRAAGFPAQFLVAREGDRTEVVMPAAIASRNGNDLSTVYFCGDASDYQLVSRFAQMFPASGGILGALGKHTGSFSTQFYWNFYEPIVRNALTNNKKIQHS